MDVVSKGVECFRSTLGPVALPVSQYYCNTACIFLYIAFKLHYQAGNSMT
jgi:hypothetical protein